jgi:hypothetical protein
MGEGSALDFAGRRASGRGPARPGPVGPDAVGGLGTDGLVADLERLVSCPECGLPAEILDRFSLASTDGTVAHVALGCIDGHFFRMPVERLAAAVSPPSTAQTRRR